MIFFFHIRKGPGNYDGGIFHFSPEETFAKILLTNDHVAVRHLWCHSSRSGKKNLPIRWICELNPAYMENVAVASQAVISCVLGETSD